MNPPLTSSAGILPLASLQAADAAGAKASNLAILSRAGLAVPRGVVVSSALFSEVLGASEAAEMRARAETAAWPSASEAALDRALAGLRGPFAVRSAALDEDEGEGSAAGIYRTLLGVPASEVRLAVRQVWASALSPAAEAYRAQRGGGGQPPRMGVVVQELVTARAAGVLFSERAGPRLWVEAVAGPGEALVSGEADPVRYRYRVGGGRVEELQVTGSPAALLSPDELLALERLVRAAEACLGPGLDLEWAWEGQQLWLLQARPVTATLPDLDAERICWTAANTQEALLDPVTPLTWSLLAPLVERGRRDLFRFAGLREIPGAGYMRLFAGRPYFNPGYFRAFLRQIPGAPEEVFDALIFGEGARQIRFEPQAFASKTWRLLGLYLLARVAARERFELFARLFALRLAALRARPVGELYDPELLALRRAATDLCEEALRRHVLGTAFAGGAYLLLGLFLSRCGGPRAQAAGVAARLTAGAAGNALAAASAALAGVARLRAEASQEDAERALTEFLARYGHRCEKEAELIEPRWADDPRVVSEVLEGYVSAARQGALTDLRERERVLSEEARALADELSAELVEASPLERVLPLRRLAFAWLLRETRRYAPYRENLKDHGLRALHLLRAVFLELGRRLAARGQLAAREDVFFLSLEDAEAALLDGRDRRAAAQAAQAARQEQSLAPPPLHVIEVPGRAPRGVHAEASAGGLIEGVGVSSGNACGRARVLSSMDEAQRLAPGEILVARVINAAWTPLFHLAGGIVAEVGGVLSHGAIVAREYGIPAVFGAAGASGIPDGAWIRVDGDLGLVTIEQGPGPEQDPEPEQAQEEG